MEDIRPTEEEIVRQEKRHKVETRRNRIRLIGLMAGLTPIAFITFLLLLVIVSPLGQASKDEFLQYFVLPIAVLAISIFIAWRKEFIGGITLIIVSLLWLYFLLFGFFTPSWWDIIIWLVLLFFPTVVSGILFILSWRIDKRLNEPQNPPSQY